MKHRFKINFEQNLYTNFQSKMQAHGKLYGDSEIISEHQLNIYFYQVSNAWSALQWIYNSNNPDQGLR